MFRIKKFIISLFVCSLCAPVSAAEPGGGFSADFEGFQARLTEFCGQAALKPQTEPARLAPALGWQLVNQSRHRGRGITIVRLSLTDAQYSYELRLVTRTGQLLGLTADRLRQGRADSHIRLRPDCSLLSRRRLIFYPGGLADRLIIQDSGSPATVQALNPPTPARPPGYRPHKIKVGHIDSGVNYLSQSYLPHASFAAAGPMLGLDLWEDDNRPFDSDIAVSAFYPRRHGRYVADILIQSGLDFGLIAVRYPRPDMTKMGAAVDWLAAQGVRIVMMPLGSSDENEWQGFLRAAVRNKQILFIISAGNNGADLSQNPIYPAVSGLANALVVTSVLPDGQLAQGSNYSADYVDFGLPAEQLLLAEPEGQVTRVSGTSFAVPRLAGLAVCVLSSNPRLDTDGLVSALAARALPAQNNAGYRYFLTEQALSCSADS